jgi:hypothetical protein
VFFFENIVDVSIVIGVNFVGPRLLIMFIFNKGYLSEQIVILKGDGEGFFFASKGRNIKLRPLLLFARV